MPDTIFYKLKLKNDKTPMEVFEEMKKIVKKRGATKNWVCKIDSENERMLIDFGDDQSETFELLFDQNVCDSFCKVYFPLEGELFDDEKKSEFKALLNMLYSARTFFSEMKITDDYGLAENFIESKDNPNLSNHTGSEMKRPRETYEMIYRRQHGLSMKPKSFSTAFKSVYEKGLMKYGFKKIKGKRPYYVRCIGNEIVHVITFMDMFTYHQDIPGISNKAFTVLFGAATVYRKKLAFDALPKDNTGWLSSLFKICFKENYCSAHDSSKAYEEMIPSKFEYSVVDEDAMMAEITKSFALTEKYAIPVLDKVTTLEECMRHFFKYNNFILAIPEVTDAYVRGWAAGDHNEGLLATRIYGKDKIEEYKNSWKKVFEESDENELYLINAGMCGTTMEEHRRNVIRRKESLKKLLHMFDVLQNTPEWQEKINRELEERKNNNIEILRECGFEV